jgi:hypothetical protein
MALHSFRLLSRGDQLPVFAFTTSDEVTRFVLLDDLTRLLPELDSQPGPLRSVRAAA